MKFLIFDNYDSFTYNLKSLLESSVVDSEITVKRNSDISIYSCFFDILVISPGPMTWKQTGILEDLFTKKIIPEKIPVLGICLGMQFIAGYYGLDILKTENPLHGSRSLVRHNGDKIFSGIPEEFEAARYNSLGLMKTENDALEFIAQEKSSGSVMALKHKYLPFAGFQFHPESFMTEYGKVLIKNFIEVYDKNQ